MADFPAELLWVWPGTVFADHDSIESPLLFDFTVPPVPDTTPPVVGAFVPAAGTQLTTSTAVVVPVTDNSGAFSSILITAAFSSGVVEQVYDGAEFVGRYAGASARSLITNGYAFALLRAGGWVDAPTLRVFAVDAAGNVGTPSVAAYTLEPAAAALPPFSAEPAAGAEDTPAVAAAGRGIILPFRRDAKNDFANASGLAVIKSNIRQIVLTGCAEESAAGEVPWDSTLGSRAQTVVHRNSTPGLEEVQRHFIVDAVKRQEPRARITRARVSRVKTRTEILIRFVPTDRQGRALGSGETSTSFSVEGS